MILVATLALATSATVTLGSIAQRRQAEQRLLEVGDLYRRAITSYLNSSPGGNRSYPGSLNDLLKDPRYPGIRRHLRQLYPGSDHRQEGMGCGRGARWRDHGVHSLSDGQADQDRRFRSREPVVRRKTALLGMGLRCSGDACRRRGARRWRRGRTGGKPGRDFTAGCRFLAGANASTVPGAGSGASSRLPSATNANALSGAGSLAHRLADGPDALSPAGPVRGWASGPRRQGNSYTVRAHCRGGILHLIKQWLKAPVIGEESGRLCGG
jgi:hypothetical protein